MSKSRLAALRDSVAREEATVGNKFGLEDRFAKAEAAMGAITSAKPVKPTPKATASRESISMPAKEAARLTEMRLTALRAGLDATRSQIVRAGLELLAKLHEADPDAFLERVSSSTRMRPGPAAKMR